MAEGHIDERTFLRLADLAKHQLGLGAITAPAVTL
jgi:hypothetical protein